MAVTLLKNGDLRLTDGRTAPSYANLKAEAERRGLTPTGLADAAGAPHSYGKQAFQSAKTDAHDHCPWTQIVDLYTTWTRSSETRLCHSCAAPLGPDPRKAYCSERCRDREYTRRRAVRDLNEARSQG
jgi:hypothetical protein